MKSKKLILLSVCIVAFFSFALYFYYSFHAFRTYSSPYGNYAIERCFLLSNGTVHYDYFYRVVDNHKDIVISESNSEGASIEQITWFKDSVCVYYSWPDQYILYDLRHKKKMYMDSMQYVTNMAGGSLVNP